MAELHTRNTDALDDLGETEEALDVCVGEFVVAGLDGGCTGSAKGAGLKMGDNRKSANPTSMGKSTWFTHKELDVLILIHADLLDVGADVAGVSGLLEVALGEVAQSLAVEGRLEVLEDEGELQKGGAEVSMKPKA